jgi:hypothetical protein
MKPNADGDWVNRKGEVIPNRYFAKKDADRFGGVPTDEFDLLKAR